MRIQSTHYLLLFGSTDFVPSEAEQTSGPAVLTVYFYLNDVEAGGGTHFSELNEERVIMPKQGKMVIWPSVLDEDPLSPDYRTIHAALPVTQGIKYGCNAWIHLRDWRTQWEKHCTHI